MVSSNGAQSLDPLRTIVGQTKASSNNTMNNNFNEFLINGVISAVNDREIVQSPNNHATAIENFLARTGGVEHVDDEKPPPTPAIDPWLHFQMAASVQKYEERSCSLGEVVVGYNNNNNSAEENNRSVVMMWPADKRRRCSEDLREKSIERKQKRMIKNRESAARSRARKQAYTHNLEAKVRELKEMNAWLNLKLKVETQTMSSSSSTVLPQKAQLRRTSSANF